MKVEAIELVGSTSTQWLTVSGGQARLCNRKPAPNDAYCRYDIAPDGSDVAQIAANFLKEIGHCDGTGLDISDEVHMIESAIRLLYISAEGKTLGNSLAAHAQRLVEEVQSRLAVIEVIHGIWKDLPETDNQVEKPWLVIGHYQPIPATGHSVSQSTLSRHETKAEAEAAMIDLRREARNRCSNNWYTVERDRRKS